MAPLSACSNPQRILPSVLLPAPFSPQMAWHEPAATVKLTFDSAVTPGNRFVMSLKAMDVMRYLRSRAAQLAAREQARTTLIEHHRDDHRAANDDPLVILVEVQRT